MNKKAIIIGAGPAGLTAAYELLKRTDITPVILEKSGEIGGISKTVNHKGNRMDIGGHRFFSKSERVMNWWFNIMPVDAEAGNSFSINYQNKSRQVELDATVPKVEQHPDKVMLVRRRLSRIYFLHKFFTYPVQLSIDTLRKLGIWRTLAIMYSYLKVQLFPRKPEKTLEDFMINRFGYTLYDLFFKDYTEKVWGVPCHEIPSEWGAQRIKGVSISKALKHAIQATTRKRDRNTDISQKDTETSLIEQFLYPKLGPGQLWEEVARQVEDMGGQILMHHHVKTINTDGNKISAIVAVDTISGEEIELAGDYFFSTMPIRELIAGINGEVPADVKEVAAGLQYRDFITVGILLRKLSFQDKKTGEWKQLSLKDTWIYIQEKDVKVGRLQLFNNWSPFMVKDPDTVWVGMEFFCNTTDDFWKMSDREIAQLAIRELEKIGLATAQNVLDSTVLRVEKTYPAYFGTYDQFNLIREYVDGFENIFLVGRNGMHKYNNADHSMLTAMVAVDNISAGITSKENIWAINTEQEYHEEKKVAEAIQDAPEVVAPSFGEYLWRNKWNKAFLWIAGIAILAQFIIFKYMYPYAGFINGDSYVYLETAYWNFNMNTYPIGYSKFLRIFSAFTHSDTALVAFQYLLLQCSALYFLFTLSYFYSPGKLITGILFVFMVFNPAFLYLSNYVSSDSLFLSLSLIWFTLLLWIINRPTTRVIVLQALVLLLAFSVRYNALFYPFIAVIAFLLSRQRIWVKLAGMAAGFLLIAGFIFHTSNQYNSLTGIRQFSPFTGWQMANNALYAYRYVDKKHAKPLPPRFKELDGMIRTYFDTTKDYMSHPQEMLVASTWYMWDPKSPLQQYMHRQFKKDSTAGSVKRWATVAPLYKDYGTYLIKQYPLQFAQHYLWPNAIKYYAPPVEFLETYNMGRDTISPIAEAWFLYKGNKVKSIFKDYKVSALRFYPMMAGCLNAAFLICLIGFIAMNGFKQFPQLTGGLLLVAGLWLANFSFSVFASPIALRFQIFPMLIACSFAFLLIAYINKALKHNV